MNYLEPRKCDSCKMTRIPDSEIVKKAGKRWLILTCRVCKLKDIEPAPKPIKIFKNGSFVDDTEFDKNQDD